MQTDTVPRKQASKRWYQRVGPGLITACVVIGPGSILTSSRVGASYGYGMSWIVVLSVLFMLVYMTLGAKLGVVTGRSMGDLVTERAGRWLAVLIGLGVFFISAAFQFGNNLGVLSAFREFEEYLPSVPYLGLDYIVIIFNGLAILLLFVFHNLYRFVERLMMVLVGLMLLSFAVNLFFAGPSIPDLVRGFVPSLPAPDAAAGAAGSSNLALIGLVGTTFVITAAYFQSYLVRQKGWSADDLADGLRDVRVGALIMVSITIMLMATAASQLRGTPLNGLADIANGLIPAFGAKGHALFCLGVFAAAYSSFIVNSMIGGFILADGLGIGNKPADLGPRLLTVAVLLTGMIVALLVSRSHFDPVPAIVAAQAVTVVAAPLVAGALWWLTAQREVMGDQRNGPVVNTLALVGFCMLLVMAWYTAQFKVWPVVSTWIAQG